MNNIFVESAKEYNDFKIHVKEMLETKLTEACINTLDDNEDNDNDNTGE